MPDCNIKPKFKKGDKIRRISGENSTTPIGFEGEISKVNWDENEWEYLFVGGGWGYERGPEGLNWALVEQPTGPVVTETVTKTRIVPGTYGKVSVGEIDVDHENKFVKVQLIGSVWINADELDAAAAVLSALARGLRDAG